ncbi:hypothetical protein KSP39_PZI001421 [Platanthera zijinensis]|uniref:UBA domain-containing protein n=1 Tax=Platanthera zijinensis TaxID=2320716 RepID=A0AAP0C1I8_9ASPA
MSPASKSKSKEKSTPRGGKDQHPKVSIKPSPVHSNGANGSSASAYNPTLGTFHALELSSSSATPQPANGRFKTMDDPEDHSGNSPGTTAEFDSFSNNGSCSGESEDPKEKLNGTVPRVETTPGCDTDKRDKIRQKNERKHQRQKEKRAQDLHERCNSFLTSRKLEALSHQLVMMGFPPDRAMMAIIANEGRMEESVAWLLLEGDDENRQDVPVKFEDKFSLKVDISDELARIAVMEAKYRCTKQDIERAVVAFEGDLSKAEENLRSQKQAISAAAVPKLDEPVDSAGPSDKIAPPNPNPVLLRSPVKGTSSATFQQPLRDERDLNHRTPVRAASPQETANRNLQQALKRMQPKSTDWTRVQVSAIDNRWTTPSSSPSVSYPPLSSPVQVSGSTMKSELPRFAAPTMGHEVKASFQASFKEPFVVMRRPKQTVSSSSITPSASPPTSNGWYPNGMEILTGVHGGTLHNLAVMGTNGSTARQIFPQNNLHRMMPSGPVEQTTSTGWGGGQSWNASGTASSSALAVPSSLGLFTGWGGSSGSSKNDWNTGGLMPHRDYTSIDWSLDLTPLRPPSRNDATSDAWPVFMGGNAARPLMNGGGGVYLPGLQERSGILTDGSAPASSQEWTSPFEGKDLFRVPRQYVTSSPTL